jgi:hypothetical protein
MWRVFTEDQLTRLLATIQAPRLAAERRLKVEKPPTFNGDRTKLRTWLSQLTAYYTAVGETEDGPKIAYTKSLLREAAAKWMIPYIEGITRRTMEQPYGTTEALKIQFGDTDAEGTARNQLEQMRQGGNPVTEYWNDYRLVATDANEDEGTMKRQFLKGLKRELQTAWANDSFEARTVEQLARWAIEKENRLNMVKQIQGGNTTTPRTNEGPRNPNGTFRTNEAEGDPMDLDATRRRPALNITPEEYKRRMREQLCLKCGKPGHRVAACRSQPNSRKPFRWNDKRDAQKPQIRAREMEIKEGIELSGNEESPQ